MVWELYLLYPMFRLPRIAYVVDKTIAHTNLDNIRKPYNNYKAICIKGVVLSSSSSLHI